MRVTAMATHPELAPSTRFRMHQFEGALAHRGIRLRYDFLFEVEEYRRLRSHGGVWARARELFGATRRRLSRLEKAELGDVVWVSRDLGPLGAPAVLSALERQDVPLVSDFDDAVFLSPQGGSPWLAPVRRPRQSFRALCRASRVVLAGSPYLAHEARRVLRPGADLNVRMLPTVVDTLRFRPPEGGSDSAPVRRGRGPTLGWVGSHSTLPYLWALRGALRDLATRVDFVLRVVSDAPPPTFPGVEVDFRRWTPESEVSVFHGLDVGLYPLSDDPWTRGKCGFKAIQYGATGVPVVCSPVGVLRDIVVPEETGLWADSNAEWVDALSCLLGDPAAAARMGRKGRVWIEDRYSVTSAVALLAGSLEDAAGSGVDLPGYLEDPRTGEGLCAASPAS